MTARSTGRGHVGQPAVGGHPQDGVRLGVHDRAAGR